jgi:hypothetical protein
MRVDPDGGPVTVAIETNGYFFASGINRAGQ